MRGQARETKRTSSIAEADGHIALEIQVAGWGGGPEAAGSGDVQARRPAIAAAPEIIGAAGNPLKTIYYLVPADFLHHVPPSR